MKNEKKQNSPTLNKATATCISCEKSFTIFTTINDFKVEACSNCHPFYTGKISTTAKAGRIERFNRRYGK